MNDGRRGGDLPAARRPAPQHRAVVLVGTRPGGAALSAAPLENSATCGRERRPGGRPHLVGGNGLGGHGVHAPHLDRLFLLRAFPCPDVRAAASPPHHRLVTPARASLAAPSPVRCVPTPPPSPRCSRTPVSLAEQARSERKPKGGSRK